MVVLTAAKLIFGSVSGSQAQWLQARLDELDDGEVEAVIGALGRARPRDSTQQADLEREVKYFRNNAERMRYSDFRKRALFVGSGVVEAGCKTVVGQRLKRSGMHWTVRTRRQCDHGPALSDPKRPLGTPGGNGGRAGCREDWHPKRLTGTLALPYK